MEIFWINFGKLSNVKYFAGQTFANHGIFEIFLRQFLGNMEFYDTKN